jgi:hypothetical protein
MSSGAADAETIGLPAARPFDSGGASTPAESERNTVFTSLVSGDNDIVGLVAYSIYKQNKHDWLIAFSRSRGREPNDDEMHAYIIGESTPRRLATYRHLAESTLAGHGPDVSNTPSSEAFAQRGYAIAQRQKAIATSGGANTALKIVIGLLALAVVAAGAWLALRHG